MITANLTANAKFTAMDKVRDIITNRVNTMEDTAGASDVIDAFEEQFKEEREFIHEMRNLLCDRTFEVYAETRKNK